MSIADREYSKVKQRDFLQEPEEKVPKSKEDGISFNKLLFRVWLLLHPKYWRKRKAFHYWEDV